MKMSFLLLSLVLGLLPRAPAAAPDASALPSVDELEALTPGAWTLVVFPDTQYYFDHSRKIPPSPEVVRTMTEWVAAEKADRNIGLVLHVGDIVDNNTAEEWLMARESFRPLNGVVPYVLASGNHEYTGNAAVRETFLNDFFKAEDNPLNDPAQGGILVETMEPARLENAAYTWTAPDGRELLILSLEWAVLDSAVQWAARLVEQERFAGHTALLVTHAYLYHDNTLYDWEQLGRMQSANPHAYPMARLEPINDGAQLWRKLVGRHPSFEMVFCGHVSGFVEERLYFGSKTEVGYRRSLGAGEQSVHQMLFNAQRQGDAGEGWLRLLEFQPDGRTVVVKTYSPWLDARGLAAWRTDPDDYFSFILSPRGPE